jgi:proteic killer suppression protein
MIKSFRHKGLKKFFDTGSMAGIMPAHAKRIRLILAYLDVATKPGDLNVDGWALHPLQGDLKEFWSVKVNGNWRITFRFNGLDIEVVDYQDYH